MKGRVGTGSLVPRQGANTVLDQHSGIPLDQLLTQSLKAVDNNNTAGSSHLVTKKHVMDTSMKAALATLTQDNKYEMKGGGTDDFMSGGAAKISANR